MDYKFLYEVKDHVATITLNRPDRLNSLTFEIYAQLRDLMAQLQYDDDVRVVVITGAGKGFCSGGDVDEIIGELFQQGVKGVLEFTRMTGALVQNMRLLDKPIIAAINGTAAGAGSVIALASDMRIMSEKSKFVFLFTKVGLTGADMGAGYLLPRIIGAGRAMEYLLMGDAVMPDKAEQIGLANKVVPPDQLMDTVYEIAGRLANGPTLALTMTKRMVNNEEHMSLVAAIEAEAQAQALLLQANDHRAFYDAFKEKRDPEWTGS